MTADHQQPDAQGHDVAHAAEHNFPTWDTYKWVALILGLITVGEVWIYYTPWKETRIFVPTLLILSALKFTIVVMFYMHLKYDAKLFRGLLLGPLTMALIVGISLLFLFGHLALHAS
jgi:cytochrome c oxidase subunit 4